MAEADSTALDSQEASGGASQPVLDFSPSNVTVAPDGGSFTSACVSASMAALGSTRGGMRMDSFTVVKGRSTLPALLSAGMPSTPVTDRAGRHVRLSTSSAPSSDMGRVPGTQGNLVKTSSPSTLAAARACSSRASGIRVCRASTSTLPVDSSSTRDSTCRSTRKDDGTTPLASPECTPSVSTSTRRLPATMPRSDVVIQSWS